MDPDTAKKTTRLTFGLRHLLLLVTVVGVLVAFLRTPYFQARNNEGHSEWERASPFTAVDVDGDKVMVQFEDSEYELVSINEVATSEILRASKKLFGWTGVKRFVEDLPQVLVTMGMPDKGTVDLVLRDATGEVHVDDAPMTEENRSQVYRSSRPGLFDGGSTSYFFALGIGILVLSLGKDARRFLNWRRGR